MNTGDSRIRQRTYFYVQAENQNTHNFFRQALPKKTATRPACEGRSSFDIFRVPWSDIECFMTYSYLAFNIFTRKENDESIRWKMQKSPAIEERNKKAQDAEIVPLSVVPFKKPPVKKSKPILKLVVSNPKIDTNTYLPFLVCPHPDCLMVETTIMNIRRVLIKHGLSTQSLLESGKFTTPSFDFLFEFTGDALFDLWKLARKNYSIQFIATKFPKNKDFSNVDEVISCPDYAKIVTDFTLLTFPERNVS